MLVMGIVGGMDRLHETQFARYNKDIHDSAAVLLEDGKVVAAVEEERLDRIKHSNKFPARAIRFCLERRGVKLKDLDRVALVNTEETTTRYVTWLHFVLGQDRDLLDGREWLREQLWAEFEEDLPRDKISFVGHHLAHAMSAFAASGFERGLLVTLDGAGDSESGTVRLADRRSGLRLLREFTVQQSLGVFYQRMCYYLGFKAFDEFKVMGLAPYGDASRYRRFFEAAYEILPDGNYALDFAKMFPILQVVRPRKPHEPIDQRHKDIAAALQEVVEKIAFAVLRYYRRQTQEPRLALAGGVAHNCTLNGKLLRSGMFDRIFVQPASHDGGTALGAALWAHADAVKEYGAAAGQSDVYWGPEVGAGPEVEGALAAWGGFLSAERAGEGEACRRAAELLAGGRVIGWVQGRSEFGPRALGNRSILADPRPAENKDIINAMVKKREGFRPFAPAVLEEDAAEFFEFPPGVTDLSFMTFVVKVREEKRALLGAVTHVDGTARIQTVSKKTNEPFWRLIKAFKDLTGVPVVLNTSFNNNAEPIVDSIDDAINCFLTTRLHHLVVRDYVVSKRETAWSDLLALSVDLAGWASLRHEHRPGPGGRLESAFAIAHQISVPATWADVSVALSDDVYRALARADGRATLGDLLREAGVTDPDRVKRAVETVERLWGARYLALRPARRGGAA
jgi:carbamoyltransferase